MSRRSWGLVLTATLAVGVALSACSSSGSGPSVPSSDLGKALAQVTAGKSLPDIEFGRPAAILTADGGKQTGPYSRAGGYGTGELASYATITPGALGFNALQATWAVTAGEPPRSGTLLAGLPSLSSVGAKSTALGATKHTSGSQTVYRFRADNAVSLSDRLAKAFSGGLSPNVLSVDGSDLRVARAVAGLDLVSGGDPTLAGDKAYTALARCLDDPLAAMLTASIPKPTRQTPATTTPPTPGVRAVAVGLSGSQGVRPTEQLCVAADTGKHATDIAASIRKALASGRSHQANEPWTDLLSNVSVSTSGSLVTVTAHPKQSVGGVLLTALANADLPGLSG